jgi:CelD/BcsL family acetyltransferase involved in cellulose biosynthesis
VGSSRRSNGFWKRICYIDPGCHSASSIDEFIVQHVVNPVASAFLPVGSDRMPRFVEGAAAPLALLSPSGEAATDIAIEIATGQRLAEIEADWSELLGRALEPNVFMDPALVRSAEQYFPKSPYVTLLAWRLVGNTNELVGVWFLAIGRPPRSLTLMPTLMAPAVPHAYLATPVIDRHAGDAVLEAMLDYIERSAVLPKVVVLDPMAVSGQTMQSLSRVLQARKSVPLILGEAQRPLLISELDGKQYLEKSQSSSTRKKLRQHRRRLEEKGRLELKIWNEPEAVRKAFEEFVQLENSGWKGQRGTAIACAAAEAAFSQAMVAALAERGRAIVYALYLDGVPISMQVVLRAGATIFTWKTAYAEAFQDFSPGMLLLEDYTRDFLTDRTVHCVNSCAYDDRSYMAAWTERQMIAQVWLDARRGSSFRFFLACRLQKAFFAARQMAKEFHGSLRRR